MSIILIILKLIVINHLQPLLLISTRVDGDHHCPTLVPTTLNIHCWSSSVVYIISFWAG